MLCFYLNGENVPFHCWQQLELSVLHIPVEKSALLNHLILAVARHADLDIQVSYQELTRSMYRLFIGFPDQYSVPFSVLTPRTDT